MEHNTMTYVPYEHCIKYAGYLHYIIIVIFVISIMQKQLPKNSSLFYLLLPPFCYSKEYL